MPTPPTIPLSPRRPPTYWSSRGFHNPWDILGFLTTTATPSSQEQVDNATRRIFRLFYPNNALEDDATITDGWYPYTFEDVQEACAFFTWALSGDVEAARRHYSTGPDGTFQRHWAPEQAYVPDSYGLYIGGPAREMDWVTMEPVMAAIMTPPFKVDATAWEAYYQSVALENQMPRVAIPLPIEDLTSYQRMRYHATILGGEQPPPLPPVLYRPPLSWLGDANPWDILGFLSTATPSHRDVANALCHLFRRVFHPTLLASGSEYAQQLPYTFEDVQEAYGFFSRALPDAIEEARRRYTTSPGLTFQRLWAPERSGGLAGALAYRAITTPPFPISAETVRRVETIAQLDEGVLLSQPLPIYDLYTHQRQRRHYGLYTRDRFVTLPPPLPIVVSPEEDIFD